LCLNEMYALMTAESDDDDYDDDDDNNSERYASE
jgi:hypothetical protein